jgi:hypothetical protein
VTLHTKFQCSSKHTYRSWDISSRRDWHLHQWPLGQTESGKIWMVGVRMELCFFTHTLVTQLCQSNREGKKPVENLTVKTSNCIQLNFQHATLPLPGTKVDLMLTDVGTPGLVLSIIISKFLGTFCRFGSCIEMRPVAVWITELVYNRPLACPGASSGYNVCNWWPA